MNFKPSRRAVLAAGLVSLPLTAAAATPFSFDQVKALAQSAARQPYAPPPIRAAEVLGRLKFDAYQRMVSGAKALAWSGGPEVRPFPMGDFYRQPVRIALVENGQAREVAYSPDLFDLPTGHPARALPADIGFAGFRVMDPDGPGDWLAFLGASYFRAPGPSGQYGLSARGLAIDTGGPMAEEFPRFTRFWLEARGREGLTVHALLDGPSLAGAYRIACRRTPAGVVQEVETTLYPRKPVATLGVAPLTSMFWYGEAASRGERDWRPELHDSDGLALWTGAGERLWRPLHDPPHVTANSYLDENPRGFGLLQRDRAFDHYQDDGAFYDRRPSLWVEPIGAWGRGSVRLVEIPTRDEFNDNVVAFWVPEAPVRAGGSYAFAYRLHWTAEEPFPPALARVVATRTGPGGPPSEPKAGTRKFVIDLEGEPLRGLTRQSEVVAEAAAGGRPVPAIAYPIVGTPRWRLMFDLPLSGPDPVDLRARLLRGAKALSETWTYQAFAAD